MQMRNPQDLFLHELSDIYDGERRIVQMIPRLANEIDNEQVKSGMQKHEQETRQQIQNLERCFQVLGAQPHPVTSHAVMGMEQDHDSFLKDGPSKDVVTMYDLGAASKTEHYEIASYRGLVDKARLMGQAECAQLLEQNLQQEERMAQQVETMSRQIGQQAMGQMAGPSARR